MNKIVREHFPVADLPRVLREGLERDAYVRVTIEPEMPKATSLGARRQMLHRLFEEAHSSFDDLSGVEAHVSALRREWD